MKLPLETSRAPSHELREVHRRPLQASAHSTNPNSILNFKVFYLTQKKFSKCFPLFAFRFPLPEYFQTPSPTYITDTHCL